VTRMNFRLSKQLCKDPVRGASLKTQKTLPACEHFVMYRSDELQAFARRFRLTATRRLNEPLALHVYEEGIPLRATVSVIRRMPVATGPR